VFCVRCVELTNLDTSLYVTLTIEGSKGIGKRATGTGCFNGQTLAIQCTELNTSSWEMLLQ
jgi:hypothetical protein